MSFDEAIKAIIKGKKIYKEEWEDKNIYAQLRTGYLQLHKADDKWYNWIISEADMQGEDYIAL